MTCTNNANRWIALARESLRGAKAALRRAGVEHALEALQASEIATKQAQIALKPLTRKPPNKQ